MPRARDYLISLIGTHMVYVNRLYAEEKFNGQYQHEGLQFRLQKLLVCPSPRISHTESQAA